MPLINFGDDANPAALLSDIVLSGAVANYTNFNNPKINAALEHARGTANPDRRAALVAEAEKLAAQQLPWIPTVTERSWVQDDLPSRPGSPLVG